ncbi:MAG: hypothetical protein IAF38_12625 [Bacteroidia bacterium]|nr:hypothetical protein [Bacteroidia bacterium]
MGTIFDFKNKNGSFTKWGKLAFFGIPISIFFAGLSEFLTYYSDQETAKEASIQARESSYKVEKIIVDLNRTLQPLKTCSVFILDLEVPLYEEEFKDYKRRLDSVVEICRYSYPKLEAGIFAPTLLTDKNGKRIPSSFSFSENSVYFPSPNQRLFYAILSVEGIEVSVYKKPVDPRIFEPFSHGGFQTPDLRINLFSKAYGSNSQTDPMDINYNIESKKYTLSGLFAAEQDQWEDNSRKIVSLPDLDSAQIFLSIGPLGFADSLQSKFLNLRKKFDCGYLNIRFNNTNIPINKKDLIKHVSANGSVFWEFKYLLSKENDFENDKDTLMKKKRDDSN